MLFDHLIQFGQDLLVRHEFTAIRSIDSFLHELPEIGVGFGNPPNRFGCEHLRRHAAALGEPIDHGAGRSIQRRRNGSSRGHVRNLRAASDGFKTARIAMAQP